MGTFSTNAFAKTKRRGIKLTVNNRIGRLPKDCEKVCNEDDKERQAGWSGQRIEKETTADRSQLRGQSSYTPKLPK